MYVMIAGIGRRQRAAVAVSVVAGLVVGLGLAVKPLRAQEADSAARYRIAAGLAYYVESNLRGVAFSTGLTRRVGRVAVAGVAELAIGPDRARRYRRNSFGGRCFDNLEQEYASDLKCLEFQPGLVLEVMAPVTQGLELHANWRLGSLHGPAVGISLPVTRRPATPILVRAEVGQHHWLIGGVIRFGGGRPAS